MGLAPRLSNDLLGFPVVWSQSTAKGQTVYHENEYALETFYSLQITPTVRLQPDLQILWNPAFNPQPGPVPVWQLQLNLLW